MSLCPKTINDIAANIALMPLSGALLLPQTQRPLMIFEPRYVAMIDQVLATTRVFGLIQPHEETHGNISDIEESPKSTTTKLKKVGTLGYLRAFDEQENGNYTIVIDGICRFDLVKETPTTNGFRNADIDVKPYRSDFDPKDGASQVDREAFLALLRTYSQFANFEFDWEGIKKISTTQLVNMCCVMSPYGAIEKQALLEANSLNQRAQTLIALAEMEMAAAHSANPGTGTPGAGLQ